MVLGKPPQSVRLPVSGRYFFLSAGEVFFWCAILTPIHRRFLPSIGDPQI
jgi:hypothetical protein